jgi:hypothetical protein
MTYQNQTENSSRTQLLGYLNGEGGGGGVRDLGTAGIRG